MNPQQPQNEKVDAEKKAWETPQLFDLLDIQRDTQSGYSMLASDGSTGGS
jgi:hypothetical protein